MAATRFIFMHTSKGKTAAAFLTKRIAYILNLVKKDGDQLVNAYKCDPAAAEMLLTRQIITDNLAYQLPGNTL